MSQLPTPRLSYTSRDYTTMLSDLESYLTQTRPDLVSDFLTTSLGTMLLEICALVGDNVSFGQDSAAQEVYLASCRRYESALRFANSVGYVPSSATPATVTVTTTSLPATLTALGGTIPAGASIAGPPGSGTNYQLLTAFTVPVSATSITLSLTEGFSFSDSFNATNQPRFSVVTSQAIVAENSWSVFVGDPTNPANKWVQVDSVALETSATNTYSISFDAQGHLIVQFGDGVAGAIPVVQITIRYNTTSGSAGNMPANSITGTITVTVNGGGTVPVLFSNSTTAATGGNDPETLAQMKINIPAFVRSGDQLVTLADYSSLPVKVTGVGQAYAAPNFLSYNGNVISVSIWGETASTFTAESQTPSMQSVTPYEAYTVASGALVTAVQQYVYPRTSATIYPQVLPAPLAYADIYINSLVYDPRYSLTTLHPAIAAAVASVFEEGTGFAIYIAALTAAIQAVPGVQFFSMDRIVFEYQGKARATGSVWLNAGVQPSDGDQVIINDGTTAWVFEFDNNGVVESGSILVAIGTTSNNSMSNLATQINYFSPYIDATFVAGATPTVNLQQELGGSALNIPIVIIPDGGNLPGSGSSSSSSSSSRSSSSSSSSSSGASSSSSSSGSFNPVSSLRATGMSGGGDTAGTVREDHRLNVNPGAGDMWAPGTYTPGAPYTGSTPWLQGGILPYLPLSDLIIPIDVGGVQYFSEVLVLNNELTYGNPSALATIPQVINLRRLVFNPVASA